jgi:large subunit ribosomal protein L19
MGPEEVVEAGLLHDPTAAAAAAQDSEVPGEAVDAQALEEADVNAADEAPADEAAEAPADDAAAEDRG